MAMVSIELKALSFVPLSRGTPQLIRPTHIFVVFDILQDMMNAHGK